ncbi:MAG: acyltransferase family protein [bacterium]
MEKNNRLNWLDSLKGIGIFFILLGHTPVTFRGYIFTFHIPLFFFASGYLFDSKKYAKFKDFLKRKFKTLIIPYIYFSAISVAIYVFYARFGATKEAVNFKDIFFQFIIAKRNSISYNKALWFLPVLFTISVIYFLLKKYIKDNLALISITIILSAMGYIYFKTLVKPKLFWTFDASIYYLVFYAFGNLVKEIKDKNKFFNYKTVSVILFLTIIVIINTSVIWNKELTEQIKFYFNSLLYAFSGIITFTILSKYFLEKLGGADVFRYLGKNSLLIFSLHLALCWPIIGKAFVFFNISIKNPNLLGLSYSVLSIIMLIPVIFLMNNFSLFKKTKIIKNDVFFDV